MKKNTLKRSSSMAVFLAVIFIAVIIHRARAVISCNDVLTNYMPCIPWLTSGDYDSGPTIPCCEGARNLDKIALNSYEDRKGICECLKIMPWHGMLYLSRAKDIPVVCQLAINMPIDPVANCSAV